MDALNFLFSANNSASPRKFFVKFQNLYFFDCGSQIFRGIKFPNVKTIVFDWLFLQHFLAKNFVTVTRVTEGFLRSLYFEVKSL